MRVSKLFACAVAAGLLSVGAVAEELVSAPLFGEPVVATPAGDEPAADESGASLTEPMSYAMDPLSLAISPGGQVGKYKGGRGLVTLSGMSGMFINPTSGTLDQGQLTLQYCLYINHYNHGDIVGHGLMAAYGVTDWLEVGWFGEVVELANVNRSFTDNPVAMTGPFVRVRLLKEQGAWQPELSIGGTWFDGNGPSGDGPGGDLIAQTSLFAAASKHWDIDRDGYLKSVRGHLGVRYVSRHEAPDLPKGVRLGTDLTTAYGGVEVELPYSLYFVAELASPDLFDRKQNEAWPYAVGFQWKPNNVLGISVAHMNPEELGLRDGFWFGIGLNFKF